MVRCPLECFRPEGSTFRGCHLLHDFVSSYANPWDFDWDWSFPVCILTRRQTLAMADLGAWRRPSSVTDFYPQGPGDLFAQR